MNIEPLDSGSPQKGERSFADLLKQIQPNVDAIPQEMRIAPLPPDEAVFESVQSYVAALGLPVGGTPATVVSVAGEFVERARLGIGRAGTFRGLPVFAFLYPHKKRFDVYAIFTRDGVDPRRLGQAVYWGIVSDIPPDFAQSKPLTMSEFWAIDAFDKKQLADMPVLESFKRELQREHDETIHRQTASVDVELARLRTTKPADAKLVEQLRAQIQRHRTGAVNSHNRAEKWKLVSCVLGVTTLMLILLHVL